MKDKSISSENDNNSDELSLRTLFSSEEWLEYFHQLAKTIDYELGVIDEEGQQLLLVNENPICAFIRSEKVEAFDCPASCNKQKMSLVPVTFKCSAQQINFAFPVEQFGERVFIVGRGGFATYEDLLEFITTAKKNNLSTIPSGIQLNFLGEEYTRTISEYIHLSVKRQLNEIVKKSRVEERLVRMTSLFDRQTFGTLSNNPQLLYRYILDTIEYVFSGISAAMMLYDEEDSSYKGVSSIGKLKEVVFDVSLGVENYVIKELRDTKVAVFHHDTEKVFDDRKLKDIESACFFPLFIAAHMKGIIAIFNKQFSYQEMKVMNAFIDYVQLNLENHDLRLSTRKHIGADKKVNYLSDFSSAIAPVLDRTVLFKTLLDKSLKLLNAEQGSLMLLDSETSELVVEASRSRSKIVKEKMRLRKGHGIAGKVLESGGSILVEDIEKDPRVRQENRPHYKTKSFISALISVEDRITGVLNISDKIKGEAFNEDDLNLIRSLLESSVIAIERSLLYDKAEELRKISVTDPLTGIYNRRYLNRRLSEEITRYNRYKHPFSFMMLDLDKFKEYNDTFGHVAGDNLIKNLAHVMEKSLRAIDIAARFGGDEFVAIFPQTPKEDAIQISNRLKEQIDKSLSRQGMEVKLGISMGLATFPDDASSIMELIEKTDQALYLAKKGGGNRVVYL